MAKALIPISVTLLGILIDTKEAQPLNACLPILVIVSGNVTDTKEVHLLNALLGLENTLAVLPLISVTVFGMVIAVNAVLFVASTLVISLG